MKLRRYRTLVLSLAALIAFAIPAHAQTTYTESVLYSFCGHGGTNCTDGAYPAASLIQGTDGNFYGTTTGGGAYGEGEVFKITPSGNLTIVYSFCPAGGTNCADGSQPHAQLLQIAGDFYGTTTLGGANGGGTVFKLTPSGTHTILYNFCSQGGSGCTDGSVPQAALILGTDGNFYGTTLDGGANGDGTVFQLTPSGAHTALYSFCSQGNCADGQNPESALVELNGIFYGTASGGGYNATYGVTSGTAFSITSSGDFNLIYTYCQVIDCIGDDGSVGTAPESGFLLLNGNFYGTSEGGGPGTDGTVYEMSPTGTLTTLSSFYGTDGESPVAGLTLGSDGNFYGTTLQGGTNGSGLGTAFNVTPSGTLTTLYNFCSTGGNLCTDGELPFAGLIQGIDGNFYGTTSGGGANTTVASSTGYGTVYKITVNTTKANSTTALTATPNPAQVGQPVTLQTTVSGTNGTPTGTINFTVGSTSIGSAILNSAGVATYSASSNGIPPGTYPVVANYSGNAYYKSSASSAYNVVLNKAATATTLTASPNPVTPPASVTLAATVARSASGSTGEPSGTVTFYYGTIALGTASLNGSGQATFAASTKGIPAGKYAITAKYNGDASDVASTSAAVDVTVN